MELEDFWSILEAHAENSSGNECWIWAGKRTRFGYGRVFVNGRTNTAHRVAWGVVNGPIPDGLCVCHDCPGGDNPSCFRPSHLWLGTDADNMADKVRKGRQSRGPGSGPKNPATGDRHGSVTHPEAVPRGDRHGSRLHPERRPRGDENPARLHPERLARGEQVSNSKMTVDRVRELRRLHAGWDYTYSQLATIFGITKATVATIVTRKTWKHVKDLPEEVAA